MSAPKGGRQSPEPETQHPDQGTAHPAQPGSSKIDESAGKNEGKDNQTANLSSNPTHILEEHAKEKTSKTT